MLALALEWPESGERKGMAGAPPAAAIAAAAAAATAAFPAGDSRRFTGMFAALPTLACARTIG